MFQTLKNNVYKMLGTGFMRQKYCYDYFINENSLKRIFTMEKEIILCFLRFS
jgi:hypothetical protein